MVIGTSYFVVFNHDISATSTHSAQVTDPLVAELSIAGSAQSPETTATTSIADVAPHEDGLAAQKLHWHFRLSPELRDFLQP